MFKKTDPGGGFIITAKEFVRLVQLPLTESWGYIYGTWGQIWTARRQRAATRPMTVKYGARWVGRHVTDCSGLIRWAFHQQGEKIVHHAHYQYTDACAKKGALRDGKRTDGLPLRPGSAVFLVRGGRCHHVGVYVGEDRVIEARGTKAGVTVSPLSRWHRWGELRGVDYTVLPEPEKEAEEKP